MDKLTLLNILKEEKIVAVIRGNTFEEARKSVAAVVAGGIKFIEVTMTVPRALELITKLCEEYAEQPVYIGAGTVLDDVTARLCMLAGARFIVSPYLNKSVLMMCHRYRVLSIPGAMSIKEAIEGMEMGADVIKLFPGSAFTPSIIKDFKGPIPHGLFMPTGGVSIENIDKWLTNGAFAVGVGSVLTAGAKTNDYDRISATAAAFVDAARRCNCK